MHTKTHLKAALHQLSLAKAEMRSMGHTDISEHIGETEHEVIALIREFYALSQPARQTA